MKCSLNLIAFGVLVSLACACTPPEEPVVHRVVQSIDDIESEPAPVISKEVAIIKTDKGEIVVEFWRDVAPNTVTNFIKLANEKFYDGTAFHRVDEGFVIQGGCPLTKDPSKENEWGKGDSGYRIDGEQNDRKHVRGVLSMARKGEDFNSASCQFFICLDEAKSLDRLYTAFGRLIRGDDVLEAIGTTKTEFPPGGGGEKNRPVARMGVETIRIVPRETLTKSNPSNPNSNPKQL